MKIGIDGRAANWYRGTGIGTYTYQLINSLNKIDHINEYLLFMPSNCNFNMKLSENFHIRSITENIKNNFWDEVNIPNILQNKEVELYHVPQNGVGLPKEKKCSFVITLHDVIPLRMPETVSNKYLEIFNEALPKLIPLCDGIITVSKYSKEDISKAFNFPKEKIYVTYLAAEDIYKPMNKDESKFLIQKYYSITDDFILYIGGFSPRKNIIGLIEAFSKAKPNLKKDTKLVIAGKHGISYNLYKNCAEKLNVSDSVIFPGFIPIDHLPYLYSAADLFVYPSFYEGFGLPPIEAMACGTPVIASNVTSIPEIVNDCAIMINPYDVEDISNAICRCSLDERLRQTMIIKGIVKSTELTFEKTIHETLIAYNKILNS